jgi:hypothetical protein
LFVLLAHGILVAARGRFELAWGRRWAAALALGSLAYIGIGVMMHAIRAEDHRFDPRFPIELAQALLGTSTLALTATALLCVAAAVHLRRRDALVIAVLAIVIGLVRAVVAPVDLYPRFLIWLAPWRSRARLPCASARSCSCLLRSWSRPRSRPRRPAGKQARYPPRSAAELVSTRDSSEAARAYCPRCGER